MILNMIIADETVALLIHTTHVKPSGKQSEKVIVCVSPFDKLQMPLDSLSEF